MANYDDPLPPVAQTVDNTVATGTTTQIAMAHRAELERALMGGTKAMREAREKYLPKEEGESIAAYDARVARTFLFNAFAKTITDMTGKVFTKPVVLNKDIPDVIQEYCKNIDLAGRNLNVFAHDVLFDSLQVGIGYIFVDMPPAVQRADGKPATLADEQAAGNRPYLVYIPLEKLIGWKSQFVGGAEVLTQIRFKETVTVPNGLFQESEIDQIRVVEPGRWSIYRKAAAQEGGKQSWVLFDQGTNSLQKIALVPFYTGRTAFMQAIPPLEKLAELNVAHWQSQSDQRNILHVARVPILFGAGFDPEAKIVVSANGMVRNSNPNAKLEFVEHTGAAIDSGNTDLQNLESQMEAMGLQLLTKTSGPQTATGEIRDDSQENAPLAMIAQALGLALGSALSLMGEFIGLPEGQGGTVQVNQDFGVSAGRTDLQQLVQAFVARGISRETLWAEMQRRGFLSDSFDPDAEEMRLLSEASELTAATPMQLGESEPPKPAAPSDVPAPPTPGAKTP